MKKQIPILLVGLLFAWFALPGALYAAFEPSAITIDGAQTDAVQKVPEGNLDAVVALTKEDTTGYTIDKYVYVWNNSNTPLNNTELGVESSSVDYIEGNDAVISVDAKTTFANSDGLAWYLHVKTVYFSTAGGTALSDDTVTPAYTFDNVAPVASIALDTDDVDQTATTSTSNILVVDVSGDTADIFKVYVHTSDQFTSTAKQAYDFSDPAQTALEYTVDSHGKYTLYAWFEDEVGNVSQDPATLQLEVLAGKSIDPAGDMNLGVGGTTAFQVSGAAEGETFTWSIVDATSGDPSTAAVFDPATPTGATATVKGATEGDSVIVKATSDTDGKSYSSGTISVIQSGYTITHNYVSGLNLVPFSLSGTGVTNASDLRSAIETANNGLAVAQIFGWDAASQSYSDPYYVIPGVGGVDDFALVEGAAYFIEVDGPGTLSLTGSEFSSISVYAGLNLLSVPSSKKASLSTSAEFDADLSNVTGLEIAQIFGWDAASQSYSDPYYVIPGVGGVDDFTLELETHGYFVEFSGAGTYTP